jgi:adenine deaminase
VVENLKDFKVKATYINGELVAENGVSKIKTKPASVINNFNCSKKKPEDFKISNTDFSGNVIEALDGQLITNKHSASPKSVNGFYESDIEKDILKMAVINRYNDAPVSLGFIKNFGLKMGAIASSVAHDSHNIIAVGVDDQSICDAVNLIIEKKGGVSVADINNPSFNQILPLPVAGLMSNEDGYKVAEMYTNIDAAAKKLGSKLSAPFMTLSFMALLVIPHLKLSDRGLFDGDSFKLLNTLSQ